MCVADAHELSHRQGLLAHALGCPMASGSPVLPAGFDDQQWYRQLYDYGMGASFGAGDADEELIPRLVQELVQPLAQHALQGVWSPASRRQSRAAAALVADLLVYVPADDGKMQARLGLTCPVLALSRATPTLLGLHLADALILASAYIQLAVSALLRQSSKAPL